MIEPVGRVVAGAIERLGDREAPVNTAGILRRADAVDFTEAERDAVTGRILAVDGGRLAR